MFWYFQNLFLIKVTVLTTVTSWVLSWLSDSDSGFPPTRVVPRINLTEEELLKLRGASVMFRISWVGENQGIAWNIVFLSEYFLLYNWIFDATKFKIYQQPSQSHYKDIKYDTNLNLPGEWTAVLSLLRVASGLVLPHQTWAKLRKNNCIPVALRPGSVSSAQPCLWSQCLYACHSQPLLHLTLIHTKSPCPHIVSPQGFATTAQRQLFQNQIHRVFDC